MTRRALAGLLVVGALAAAPALLAQPVLFYPTNPNGGSQGPRTDRTLILFTVNVTNGVPTYTFTGRLQDDTIIVGPVAGIADNVVTAIGPVVNVLREGRNQFLGVAIDGIGLASNVPDLFTQGPSFGRPIFIDTDTGIPNNPRITGLVSPSTNVTIFSIFRRRLVFNRATPTPLTVNIAGQVLSIPDNPAVNPSLPEVGATVTATIVPTEFSNTIAPLISPLQTPTRPVTVAFAFPTPPQPGPGGPFAPGDYNLVPASPTVLDFTGVRDGIYSIRLRARDIANRASPPTTFSELIVDVDRTVPQTPAITFPTTTVPFIVDGLAPPAPIPGDRFSVQGVVLDERLQGNTVAITITNSANLVVPTNPTTMTTSAAVTGIFSANFDFRPGAGIVPSPPPPQDVWRVDLVASDPALNRSGVRSIFVIRDQVAPPTPSVTFPLAGSSTSARLFPITGNVTNTLTVPANDEHGSVRVRLTLQSTVNPSVTATFEFDAVPSVTRHDSALDNAFVPPNALGTIPDFFTFRQVVDLSSFPFGPIVLRALALDGVGGASALTPPITFTFGPPGPSATLDFATSGPDDNYQFIGLRTNQRGADDGDPDGVPGFFVSQKSPERLDVGVPPSTPRPPLFGAPPLDTDPGTANLLRLSGRATDVATPVTLITAFGASVPTTSVPPAAVSTNTLFGIDVDLRRIPEGIPSLVTVRATNAVGLTGATTSVVVFRDVFPGRAPRITFPPLIGLPFGAGTIQGFFTGRPTTPLEGVAEPNALVAVLTPITTGIISVPIARTSSTAVPNRASARNSIPVNAQLARADASGIFRFTAVSLTTVQTATVAPVPILVQAVDSFDNTDPVSSVTPVGVFRTDRGGDVVEIVLDPLGRNFRVFPGTPPAPVLDQFFTIESVDVRVTYSTIISQAPTLRVGQFGAVATPAELISPAQSSNLTTQVLTYRYRVLDVRGTFDGPVSLTLSGGRDVFGFIPNPGAFTRLLFIDSTAPRLEPLKAPSSFFPRTGQQVPAITTINVTATDVPASNGSTEAAAISTVFSTIRLVGPLERTPAGEIALVEPPPPAASQTPAQAGTPFTFVRAPLTPVVTGGTYEIRAQIGDNVGNSATFVSSFILDRQAVNAPFIVSNPADRSAVSTLPRFGRDQAVFVTILDPQPDLTLSRAFLLNPNRVSIGRAAIPTGSNTLVVRTTSPLAGGGRSDGVYFVEADIFDRAGNPSPRVTFTFTLDTLAPDVLVFSPANLTCARALLREVHAEVIDTVPPPPNPFPPAFSGVDLTRSSIRVRLVSAAAANRTTPNTPIQGQRRFRTIPGSRITVLDLQFTDSAGRVRPLTDDGTEDGLYAIDVTATDVAGNSRIVTGVFTHDTVPPQVTLASFPEGSFFADSIFVMGGEAFDPSGCGFQRTGTPGVFTTDTVRVSIRAIDARGQEGFPIVAPLFDFRNVNSVRARPSPAPFVRDHVDWVFTGTIPARPGRARVLVRVRDLAGNTTVITRDITIRAGALPPPALVTPRDGFHQREKTATFAWTNVTQAHVYDLELTRQTPTALTTRTTFFAIEFPRHGFGPIDLPALVGTVPGGTPINVASRFSWRVRSSDVSLNAGAYSTPSTFVVDPNAPRVATVQVGGIVSPAVPAVDAGTFGVTITFSEETAMDPARGIRVFLRQANPLLPPVAVEQVSYRGNQFVGRFTTPPEDGLDDAGGTIEPDGRASLVVRDAFDLAGNALAEEQFPVQIALGPLFEVRFFANPAAPEDLEVVINARTLVPTPRPVTLVAPPIVFVQQHGLPFAFPIPVFPVLGTPIVNSSFRAAFRVEPRLIGVVDFTVTGQVLGGPATTRHFTVAVAGALALAGVRFPLALPGSTVGIPAGRKATVMTLPAHAVPPSVWARARDQLTRRGLRELAAVGYLTPDGPSVGVPIDLVVPATALRLPAGVHPRQVVLVRVTAERDLQTLGVGLAGLVETRVARSRVRHADTYPLPPRHQRRVMVPGGLDGQAPSGVDPAAHGAQAAGDLGVTGGGPAAGRGIEVVSDRLGLFLLAVDATPPELTVAWPSGPVAPRVALSAHATDAGSGVDRSSGQVVIGERVAQAKVREDGVIDFESPWAVGPGEHEVEVRVADRAGNAVVSRRHRLTVGGPVGIDQAVFVPNPVRQAPARLRVRLTGSCARLVARIHDAGGALVRTLSLDAPSSTATLQWDLDRSDGGPVANGVYLFTLEARGSDGRRVKRRGKLAVLR